ncbi:hypothetical protein HC660_27060 [Bacillus mojavensis]|uniref:Phage protein n=1 Tax=Bacillus mojavensis TaxID=72360 RepID=A0ABX6LZ68_BACMO|nr:hypothetical protein [Bacillus mojavensis]QJC97180.1 hypothetical protein HC660_27060 [Bacillus mojavensis]
MYRLNKKQLEEIRKRSDKATVGHWRATLDDPYDRTYVLGAFNGGVTVIADIKGDADAEFIANARQDIPALLEHIAEVEQELREATLIIDRVENLLSKMRYGTEYEVYDEVYRFLYGKGDENDNV